jgi:acyl-CoA-dependent ceramide synthase
MSTSPIPASSHGSTTTTSERVAPPNTTLSTRAPRRTGKPQHMNGPLYRQANDSVVLVRRAKRKNESPLKQLTRWFVNNQIGALNPIDAAALGEELLRVLFVLSRR